MSGRPAKLPPNPLEVLLAEQRRGAESVEKGHFRLDWTKALDKVKRFQLTDPHRYVLEVVQGAVAGDATHVEVTTDADDVILSWDATPVEAADLEQLFDYLFAQDDALTPHKQLALAVNSALALSPKFVRLDVGDGGTGHRLELSTHTDLRVTPLNGDEQVTGARLQVRDRVSWQVFADLFRSESVEAHLVGAQCRYAPVPVVVNGRDVASGLGPHRYLVDFAHGGTRGQVAIPQAPVGPSVLSVCMNGVEVVEHHFDDDPALLALGFVAWVDAPDLTRNASHSDIHRDTRYASVIKRVRAAVRDLQEQMAAALLLDESGAPRPPESLDDQELATATLLARVLLRCGKKKLPPALDAMLDLPGIVSVATDDVTFLPLRAVWNQFRKRGNVPLASRHYDVRLGDIPGGMIPVLGPQWVVRDVFGGTIEGVDVTLTAIEQGQKLRKLREGHRRDPDLGPSEVLIDVPIDGGDRGIRGELGIADEIAPSVAVLVDPSGSGEMPQQQGGANTLIVYSKRGVPLGGEWIQTALLGGVALVDSDAFEPEPDWTSFHANKATRAARGLVDAAVPRVAEAMARSFSALPPVQSLVDAGAWTPLPGDNARLMREISANWPTDELARRARGQIDVLLSRRKIPREEAPALWAWPLFYTLDGHQVSLDQISGQAPVGDDVVADWRIVIEEAWGDGATEGSMILNVTDTEREALKRQLGRAPHEGNTALTARRLNLAEEAEAAQVRSHNMALAEQRRQRPELSRLSHEAIVDLDLPGGRGQAGIPSLSDESRWIRYLFDGLPLPDDAIDNPFPIHVVVELPGLEPDAAFEEVKPNPLLRTVFDAVVAARPALMAAFAGRSIAYTRRGTELLWGWLADHPTPKKKPMSAIPDGVLDAPIVPTVSGEKLTLRALANDALPFGHFRYVEISPGRQDSPRPIVVCGKDRCKLLSRLLGVTAKHYARELRRELAVLDRKSQPRRSARLSEATAISRTFDDDDFTGEIGLSGHRDSWVDVLIDSVPLERRPLELGSAPFIAVIDGSAIKANNNFTHVRKNSAWKKAEKLLAREADQLIVDACQATVKGHVSFGGAALLASLRAIASDRFDGRPQAVLEPKGEVEQALAAALIWESVDPRDFVSLSEVAEHWRSADVVWVVDEGEGQLAAGRVMVRADASGQQALRKIFGKRVRDGKEVFERDQEAIRRRASALPIHTRLTNTFGPIDLDAHSEELGLTARGQVGVPTLYRTAVDGLAVSLGVDGHQLADLTVDTPMRAVAAIDTSGLAVDATWTKPSNQKQVNWLNETLTAAAWQAAEHAAHGPDPLSGPGAEERRRLLLDLLAAAGPDRADLRAHLEAMPLFRTVQQQTVSIEELRKRIASGETIYAVGDDLGEGAPHDGRTIVRGDVDMLIALTNSLEGAVTRDDNRWRDEIAGARRFQSLLQQTPELSDDCAEELYFDEGPSRGLIGLLRPFANATLDDSGDPPSRLRLHIGGRNVVNHAPVLHPAVEVWVDNDRLQPTLDFSDVERDDVYDQLMATVEAQLPELVARAAAHWAGDPTGRVRLRLGAYVLSRHAELDKTAAATPGGPEARLLDVPMWTCLTGNGTERLSTRHILAASGEGKLRTAKDDAAAERTESGIACVLGEPERAILTQYVGKVPDYTGDLERLAARRNFLAGAQVRAIEVAAISRDPLLIVRRLDTPGWEGEVALSAHVGRGTELHLYVERRHFGSFELPGLCRAVVAVEHPGLTPSPRYDDIARDAAWDEMVARIGAAVQDALVELAAGPIETPQAQVLLDALTAARAARAGEGDGLTRVIDALEKAPLLRDVGGDRWSIAALRDKFPDGAQVPYVGPATAAAGDAAAGDRITLVIDDAVWAAADRLLPLARDDQRYLESAAGQKRREQAPTRYMLPRGAVAEAEVSSALFNGTLALSAPPAAGRIGVMSHGRLVQERELPDLFGLCGFIDGAIETDRGFEHATLREAHETELTRLWGQRLQAAALEAADWRGRRSARWQALAGYTQRFLIAHLDDLGPSQRARRDAVATPPQELPQAVARALAAPIVQTNNGEWVSVAAAIGGDDPVAIVAEEKLKRPPRSDARVLLGDQVTLRLLSALLGSSSVMSVEQARAATDATKKQAAAKRREAGEAHARRAASAENRTLSALRSLLRAATTPAFPLRVARDVSTAPVGEKRPLCQRDGDAITVNTLHPLWKQTVAAKTDDIAGAVIHLAAGVIAAITALDGTGLLAPNQAVEVLTILGDKRR